MPGIVGLITKKPREQAAAELSQMVGKIRHESFYKIGTWMDESLGVYVGWSVMENSFAADMPLHDPSGDISLIFSGEENSEQGSAGPAYLVGRYENNPTFPANLNGMFHGLTADRKRKTTILFNDRFGMHRMYYHEAKDAFYFAAEAKAILAVRPELRRADIRGLGEFLAYSAVLENRTLFEGIRVLPPGSAWIFDQSATPKKNFYFEPKEWEQQEPLDAESYYQGVRDAFSNTLPRYFNGKEKAGVALTGGLDTRAIMAWWKPKPDTLPCYTFGGPYRECQDVLLARRVAELTKQHYEVISVGDEFLSNFSKYAERSIYMTDGGVDLTRCPDLYVSEKARAIAPVKVVGTFGSEILRQMAMFKPIIPRENIFRPELMTHLLDAEKTYHRLKGEHPLTFAVFRQFPWYHFGVFQLERTHLTVRSPYLDNEFVRMVYRAPSLDADISDVRLRLISEGSKELGRIRSDRGVGGNGNQMLAAARRSYLEFTFKAEYAYDYGMPQWVSKMDHAVSALHLERLFLGRHKFLHFRVWYRDQLAGYVRDMLLDSKALSRPYIERKGLEAVVNGHLTGGLNYTTEIHKLLTMEILHRLFLD